MKTCTKCGASKDTTEFFKTVRSKDGLQPACKACMNVAYAVSRSKKKDHYNKATNDRRLLIADRIRSWKAERGCTLCPERVGWCLELHHLDPAEKEMNPSQTSYYSWRVFLEEAQKCAVLCSNCHKKVHAGVLDLQGMA